MAVHLHHRESRDLDFFTTEPLDTDELIETLERSGLPFLLERSSRNRNVEITLSSTKVEFSAAPSNPLIEPTGETVGIAVAGLGDLLAMKLAAITKRRQLRDYQDIKDIEEKGGRRIEEGLALAVRRYNLRSEDSLVPIVAALGASGECPEDPVVTTPREEIASYFDRRLPELLSSLGRWDNPAPPDDVAVTLAELIREEEPPEPVDD